MKQNNSSKVQYSAEFVRTGVESGRFLPGAPLPSARSLAAEAGVSYVTMWKAIASLRKSCLLVGRTSQIPRVASARTNARREVSGVQTEDVPAPRPVRGLQAIVVRIRGDLISGRFPPGSRLPPFKQLENQYLTTRKTLRKALAALCAEGIVAPLGKGYAMPQFTASVTDSQVVLIVPDAYAEYYFRGMRQGHDYIREAEICASQAGVRLLVEAYPWVDNLTEAEQAKVSLSPSAMSENTLGYIFITRDARGSERFLRQMSRRGRPIAVLEQVGDWVAPPWMADYPLRTIPVGVTAAPGLRMGRFLSGCGHKRIAYISPYHPSTWSNNRYAGLSLALEQAGLHNAVDLHSIDPDDWAFAESGWRFHGDPAMVPHIRLELPEIYQSALIVKEAQRLETILRERLDPLLVLPRALRGLFDRILRDRSITAWVAAEDGTAAIALEYLRSHKARIPQGISLASFDNSYTAIANQITSYDFNIPAILNTAFGHVLQRDKRSGRKRAHVQEIDGMIVERQTTGKAGG